MLLVLVTVLVSSGCASSARELDVAPPDAPSALGQDRDRLRQLPTRGGAWDALLEVADGDLGDVRLSDQESTAAGRTFAAALVYVRTGDVSYRNRVVRQLEQVPTSSLRSARALSVARQLAGFVLAADLVSYREQEFVSFVDEIRTRDLGNHGRWRSLHEASQETASNWGAWATASRIAAALYVGDDEDVAAAADVLRAFLGEGGASIRFEPTDDFDPTWVCGDPERWLPVNPPGCGDRSGALVEEVSRSAGRYPSLDDTGLTYSWEALGGALLSADLLADNGYADVHEWGDRALLRAAQFLHEHGGYPTDHSVNHYIPWVANDVYDVELGPLEPAGLGRQYGFTDWLSAG